MPKRVCANCGETKDVYGAKICPKDHFICKDCARRHGHCPLCPPGARELR